MVAFVDWLRWSTQIGGRPTGARREGSQHFHNSVAVDGVGSANIPLPKAPTGYMRIWEAMTCTQTNGTAGILFRLVWYASGQATGLLAEGGVVLVQHMFANSLPPNNVVPLVKCSAFQEWIEPPSVVPNVPQQVFGFQDDIPAFPINLLQVEQTGGIAATGTLSVDAKFFDAPF